MNERAETGDRFLDTLLNSTPACIIVPPGMIEPLARLVAAYAAQHGEKAWDCCRAIEIAVLQRGLKAMQDDVSASKKLGELMGWPVEEEGGA